MVKIGCCGFTVGRGRYLSRFRVVEVTAGHGLKWQDAHRGAEFRRGRGES